jgi:hypothetical protein
MGSKALARGHVDVEGLSRCMSNPSWKFGDCFKTHFGRPSILSKVVRALIRCHVPVPHIPFQATIEEEPLVRRIQYGGSSTVE